MCPSLAARPLAGPGHSPALATRPMPSATGLRVLEVTDWRDYSLESDIRYEWSDGRLEEKPVSDYETYFVYARFVRLLQHFLNTRPIARMVALKVVFRLALPIGIVIRKPDLGMDLADNPRPPGQP
jgi:hypothetical protein